MENHGVVYPLGRKDRSALTEKRGILQISSTLQHSSRLYFILDVIIHILCNNENLFLSFLLAQNTRLYSLSKLEFFSSYVIELIWVCEDRYDNAKILFAALACVNRMISHDGIHQAGIWHDVRALHHFERKSEKSFVRVKYSN